MPAYTKTELDGKTVELEMPDRSTRLGVLHVRHVADGLSIEVEYQPSREGEKPGMAATMPERKFLRKHPRRERAEFIWAEHIS
jgi:hypothetical protein